MELFFSENRRLIDLFRTKEFFVCNECIKKYPFEIEYNYFPLEGYVLEVISLFKRDRYINYDAFLYEYSEIYKKITELNKEKLILFNSKLFITEENIKNYSYISTLLDTNIIILTNVLLI